jgi:hypothetical protein
MRSPFVQRRATALLFALAIPAVACSSDHDRVERQLAKLREQVTELQADTDRMGERLDVVEASKAAAPPSDQRMASVGTETLSRPKLKVVRVEPDDALEAQASDADSDAGPRVVIQGEGKTLETRTLPGASKPAPKADKVEKSDKPKAEKAEPTSPKK